MAGGPALLFVDPGGRFTYASPAAAGILGLPREELVGRTWSDPAWRLGPPHQEDGAAAAAALLADLGSGRTQEGILLDIERADGSRSILNVTVAAVRGADGSAAGCAVSMTDVTSAPRGERARSEAAERRRPALEVAPKLTVELDGQGCVTGCSDALLRLAGLRRADVIGHDWFDLFLSADDRADQRAWYGRCLAAGELAREFECEIATAGGESRLVLWSGVLQRDLAGAVSGAALAGQDVTERRRLQEQLVRARHLQSVGAVAGGMANEFNNILTAILGNLSLARLETDAESDLARTLAYIERAALRARGLTERLLVFGRGGEPAPVPTAVGDLVRETAATCVRGIRHRCEIAIPERLDLVEVDPDQMRLVLTNLLLSAVEATPGGGTIRVEAALTTPEGCSALPMRAGSYVRVSVADDGPAVTRRDLERIFEPGPPGGRLGSGLGLATTYFVVKANGGYVQVDPGADRGTVRSIFLPLAPTQAAARPAAAEAGGARAGTGRILIVDDDEMVRNVAGRMLRHLGYKVGFARDEEDAAREYAGARSAGTPFDLVIVDLKLAGGASGTDAMLRLRRLDPGVRAVISSGLAGDEAMTGYAHHGFRAAVRKPYQLAELGRVVAEVLKG